MVSHYSGRERWKKGEDKKQKGKHTLLTNENIPYIIGLTILCFWKVKVKVAQSCPTLCELTDYTVHGILQARVLEWVAVSFFRGSSHPGIEPRSPALQAYSLPAEPQVKHPVFISLHISEVKWLCLSKLFQNTFLSCFDSFIISLNEDNLTMFISANVSSLQKRSLSLQVY